MTIYIARHAQTDYNIEGKEVTGKDHIHLNEEGKRQLISLENRLKDVKLDKIISSPSVRTLATAEPIAELTGLEITEDPLTREKSNGDWEDLDPSQHNWESLEGTFETRKAPKGESLTEVKQRAEEFFAKLVKLPEQNILVVSHAAFLKIFIGHLLNMPIRDSIFKLKVDNSSLSVLSIKDATNYKFEVINETSFLEE